MSAYKGFVTQPGATSKVSLGAFNDEDVAVTGKRGVNSTVVSDNGMSVRVQAGPSSLVASPTLPAPSKHAASTKLKRIARMGEVAYINRRQLTWKRVSKRLERIEALMEWCETMFEYEAEEEDGAAAMNGWEWDDVVSRLENLQYQLHYVTNNAEAMMEREENMPQGKGLARSMYFDLAAEEEVEN